MGSPLGPTLANWFLGKIEKQIFIESSSILFTPQLYVRYVDDIFAVFDSEDNCNKFFALINKLHPNLRFTIEYPKGTLQFLDVEVKLEGSSMLTWVHSKTN